MIAYLTRGHTGEWHVVIVIPGGTRRRPFGAIADTPWAAIAIAIHHAAITGVLPQEV